MTKVPFDEYCRLYDAAKAALDDRHAHIDDIDRMTSLEEVLAIAKGMRTAQRQLREIRQRAERELFALLEEDDPAIRRASLELPDRIINRFLRRKLRP